MFSNLLRLHYSKDSSKVPLEDFNTEVFAGILEMYPDILKAFCKQILGLVLEDYNFKVQTQRREFITGDPNCIIDLVLINEDRICFIENKVESTEGWEQLARYIKALRENHALKEKHLFYCTKYADPKAIDEKGISFNQFRWYEVAKILNQFANNPVVKNYLQFLENHKMSQDNTIKSENLLTIENLRKSIDIVQFHVDNAKKSFEEKFGIIPTNKNFHWDQLLQKNRICYYNSGVLPSANQKWSEILYGIEFNTLRMITQVYVDYGHDQITQFQEQESKHDFNKIEFENLGVAYQQHEDLGRYLNDPDADKKIQAWFIASFSELKNFISDTKENLNWNLPEQTNT